MIIFKKGKTMKLMNNRKPITALALAMMLSGVAYADTWYFTGNEASSDTGAFTDATKWKDAGGTAATAFSAADTYVLTNFGPNETAATEHVLRAHGGTFAGGARLELNAPSSSGKQRLYIASDSTPANPTVFSRGLLLGGHGAINPVAANATNAISGEVNLIANNGGRNPLIQPLLGNNTFVFNGEMTGGSGKALMVYPALDANERNFTLKFLGNVTWGGEMYVRDWNGRPINLAKNEYNVRLVFGSISFNPTFRIDGNGTENVFTANTLMRIAVDTVDDTVTFQNGIDASKWPFHHDTYLEFPVDVATGKAGKMVLEERFYGSTNEYIGVILNGDLFGGAATNRFALMSVPVAYPLNASAFHLVKSPDCVAAAVKFEVVNDATHSTLYAVVPPMVQYVQSDSTGQAGGLGTHINLADGWSDNDVPRPGKDYFVPANGTNHRVLRTPDSDLAASYEFPGHSLTIASNASLRAYLSSLRIADLRMLDGSALYCSRAGSNERGTLTLEGGIDVSGTVRIGAYHGITMRFDSSFTGSGTLDFGGMWIVDDGNATYSLCGASPYFTGKMVVRTAYRDSSVTPGFDTDYATLSVTNGNAFGANLSAPTPDAVVLTDYAMLTTARSFTLAKESNRGITVGTLVSANGGPKVGRLWTSDGKEMRIETSLTVDGSCYKQGVGVLTLAGTAVSVNGGGADRLVVSNGLLRVAGAQAINGLAVHFARDTQFQIVPDLSNAAFTAKGADVSALDTPITLDASFGGKIPFAETPVAERAEAPYGTTEYGILTVKATSADAVRAMLPANPPRHFAKGHLSWTEKTVDGLTTFGVRHFRGGICVILY